MIPNTTNDCDLVSTSDDSPRFFLDARLDALADDTDWWLDLGAVDLPVQMAG